jgi:transposase-like protein
MYLMTTTRSGVSAKHIERMTGVTYKTAWRMMKEIRSLMENGGLTLSGIVEVDETYVGGVQKGMRGRNPKNTNKTVVMGMVERGGRLKTQVVPNAKAPSLLPHIQKSVAKGTWIVSDELYAYKPLTRMGYPHDSINHSRQYVDGNIHTNTIEGFWSQLKLGIRCVYRHVDRNYLQSYANEYAWRYSYRKSEVPMFDLLLGTTSR